MLGLFPSSVLTRGSGHPHTSFSEFQWEVKVAITRGTSLYVRGIWLSPHRACWSWHEHTLFGGVGEGLLGALLWIFQDFSQGSLSWKTVRKIGKLSEIWPCLTIGASPSSLQKSKYWMQRGSFLVGFSSNLTDSKKIIWKHWVVFVLSAEVYSSKIKGFDHNVVYHLGFRRPSLGRNYLLASMTFWGWLFWITVTLQGEVRIHTLTWLSSIIPIPALRGAEELQFSRDAFSEIPYGMKCKEVWSQGVLGLHLAPLLDLENVI